MNLINLQFAMDHTDSPALDSANDMTTREVAQLLGLAVRSVQLMVDRGDLQAWKTTGGHRRISRESVSRWLSGRQKQNQETGAATFSDAPPPTTPSAQTAPSPSARRRASDSREPAIVLIEDSAHFQNVIRLLLRHTHPSVRLHVASDAVTGLALCGAIRPDVLIVDILLPGVDGATLVQSVRSQPLFEGMQLVVVTALDAAARVPYAWALSGLPVIEKHHLARELPATLSMLLTARRAITHPDEPAPTRGGPRD
jgi:excisionase family DNA binding protein